MKIYGLTALGKKAAKRGEGPPDEVRILEYMRGNRDSATDSELDVVSGESGYLVRRLKSQRLIEELTG